MSEYETDHTETYLGDGLYASFDGYQIKLRAPRDREQHIVYLEPFVLAAFEAYIAKIRAQSLRYAASQESKS